MRRDTLGGFFRDYIDAATAARDVFVVHDNGFRTRTWTYAEIAAASHAFAAKLAGAGLKPGDKLVLWGENRGEWIAALWGARLASVVAVPVDYRSSAEQAHRIREIVQARVMLVGAEVTPASASVDGFEIWRMDDASLFEGPAASHPPLSAGLAEIIFTSGATSDPKGVTLTDGNLLANIHPVEAELAQYGKYLRLARPLRFLNLLPLSHMFGQSLATFVPPMLRGTVVFSSGYSAEEIVRQIKSRRVTVLVCVPKVLDMLREQVNRENSTGKNLQKLRVHRMFGWKFWAIVVGGAPLAPDLEKFWRGLGFLVIQGYGLTETAPIVTLNHPLKKGAPGSVGTAISGVEIRIADDGEILVRGENVTAGYYNSGPSDAFRDGWFHTGDVGELDAEGRLTIKGRKKEMIVTAQGLNVFPDDVERVLDAQPGVRESAVVGVETGGGSAGKEERVCGVVALEPGASADEIMRAANRGLEPHQRLFAILEWPGGALPRTEGTRKLKRKEIQRWAQSGSAGGAPAPAVAGQSVAEIVSAAAGGRAVASETRFDELGLGSLDRMQLLARLEDAFHTSIDEGEFAAAETVGALERLVGAPVPQVQFKSSPVPSSPVPSSPVRPSAIPFPSWSQSLPIRAIRRVSMPTWVLALSRPWMKLTVEGLENLEGLDHPVIFAPNHQSHMDTPAMLQALPAKWRYRVSPAMAKEWFKAHFFPEDYPLAARVRNTAAYLGATVFYNCFPIPQYEAGQRQTIRFIGTLFDQKRSLLIFPEGKRTDYGEIAVFRPGIGLIASKLGVPVVPVRIEGLDKVLHLSWSWPRRGPARITFGKPMYLHGNDYRALAAQVRDAVVALRPYTEPPELASKGKP